MTEPKPQTTDYADETEKQFKHLMSDHFGIEKYRLTDGANILGDFGLDSLDAIELLMSVEADFGIDDISDDEAEKVETVGDAVNLIRRKLHAQAA